MLFVHFLDFKANMEKQLRRITDFLDLPVTTEGWTHILEACDYHRVSQRCREEVTIESPFWNGGSVLSEEAAPDRHWQEHLNNMHEAQLINRFNRQIGALGKKWVLCGTPDK